MRSARLLAGLLLVATIAAACGVAADDRAAVVLGAPVSTGTVDALASDEAFLQAVGVDAAAQPPWLFGHSDGGSIALLHAARFPARVAGLVVLAPHIMVEEVSIASIERARQAYVTTDLRQRLARHHDDPDSAFRGWNDIWLDPAFRTWSIVDEIAPIACPMLAVQGLDDEYGTLEQIHGIARRLPQTELLEIPACGHSPHRDQPDALERAVADFLTRHGAR